MKFLTGMERNVRRDNVSRQPVNVSRLLFNIGSKIAAQTYIKPLDAVFAYYIKGHLMDMRTKGTCISHI
jgi:hypothetical protein